MDNGPVRHVVVVTGAGMSAPSGLATYRSAGSAWDDPALERRSRADRYGNHLPELWAFWGATRAAMAAAAPNAGHLALAAWQDRLEAAGGTLLVVTQNVDGLHGRAGSRGVLELHGSLARSRCIRCRAVADDARVPGPGEVPKCPSCPNGRLRPDVVLFGEDLSRRMVGTARAALRRADLCVYAGTSGNVWPVRDLVSDAKAGGARCVLVNADPWDDPHPAFDRTVLGDVAEVLPELAAGAPAVPATG